jgi:hypothetical protein
MGVWGYRSMGVSEGKGIEGRAVYGDGAQL